LGPIRTMYLVPTVIFVTLLTSALSELNLPLRDILANPKELKFDHNIDLEQDEELIEFWNRDLASSIISRYKLLVVNGGGTGKYRGGSTVNIHAELCPSGQKFSKWIIMSGSPQIQNIKNPDTILKIPDSYAAVKAVCTDDPYKKYKLKVDNGDPDGEYFPGAVVEIAADLCPAGQEFDRWIIKYGEPIINEIEAPKTNIIMPEGDTRVRAECRNRSISLIVLNGEGDGTYSSGVVTPIVADEPSKNKIFDKWVVRSGNPKIDNAILSNTKLQMPNEDVIVEATYKNKLFELEVRNGKGRNLDSYLR